VVCSPSSFQRYLTQHHQSAHVTALFGIKELFVGNDPEVEWVIQSFRAFTLLIYLPLFDSIIAIHGLDGDRELSFTADNGILWLRDLVPPLIPNARVLTYGYDAYTKDRAQLSTQSLYSHGVDFVSKLVLYREATMVSLPYSAQGGLLVYTEHLKDKRSAHYLRCT
jgi:hypothetical protein